MCSWFLFFFFHHCCASFSRGTSGSPHRAHIFSVSSVTTPPLCCLPSLPVTPAQPSAHRGALPPLPFYLPLSFVLHRNQINLMTVSSIRVPCNITLISGTMNRKETFQRETGIKVSALSVSKAFMKGFGGLQIFFF